jgi:DNA-binding IclR family transcriptional regulator
MAKWGFLTNHALVLFHVFQHPQSTLREIAEAVGITERAALSCLRLMEAEGLVSRTKEGRRNRYAVNVAGVLAHQTQGGYSIEQIALVVTEVAAELRRARAG